MEFGSQTSLIQTLVQILLSSPKVSSSLAPTSLDYWEDEMRSCTKYLAQNLVISRCSINANFSSFSLLHTEVLTMPHCAHAISASAPRRYLSAC